MPTFAEVFECGTGVALSLVVSLDGQLCGPDGSSRSISGPEDLQWLRTLRAAADVVVVGAATAKREHYRAFTIAPEFEAERSSRGLAPTPELRIIDSTSDVDAALTAPRVLLEAGIRLHAALAQRIDRLWISHAPVLVGNTSAALAIPLSGFRVAGRYAGSTFVVTRLERR